MRVLKRNLFVLFLLALIFAAPGMFAFLFYHHPHWLGSSRTNKGTLLSPPILLTMPKSHQKWRLLLWSPETCREECVETMDKLARVRLALGRRLYEVESWLLLGVHAEKLSERLANTAREEDIQVFKYTETQDQGARLPVDARIFLENPAGFLVLSYGSETTPDDIFRDIKRLLKTQE